MAGTPRKTARSLQERLYQAIIFGDEATIERILSNSEAKTVLSLDLRPGLSVTQAAVQSGREHVLRRLLEAGADVNQPLWNGDSLLHVAIKGRQPAIVKLLLEFGADTRARDRDGLTVLQTVMMENLPDMARIIIAHGNDPAKTFELATRWLGYAREKDMKEMVAVLEDLSESFEQHDPEFKLYTAIICNHHKRIVDLVDQHVDPFAVKLGRNKMSALHAASRQPDVRVLAMLLSRLDRLGRMDAKDRLGQTPLHYAAAKNNASNVDWLLFSGADPEIKDKDGKLAEELTTEKTVRLMFQTCWTSVPDIIVAMRGKWLREFPTTDCVLSRSRHQAPDADLPPVLMFRSVVLDDGEDAEEKERLELEVSSFRVEEVCWEVYEYRCSDPSPVLFRLNAQERSFDGEKQTLVLKHRPRERPRSERELTVKRDGQAPQCEVKLTTSGILAVVCRTEFVVASVPVGPSETTFKPEEFPGLELKIPEGAFLQEQEILIKAEESHLGTYNRYDDGESSISPIKNMSCFYNILNTSNDRPHKSIVMSIPMKMKTENVMALVLKQAPPVAAKDEVNTDTNTRAGVGSDIDELQDDKETRYQQETHHSQDLRGAGCSSDDANDDGNDVYNYSDDECYEPSSDVAHQPSSADVTHQPSSDVVTNQEPTWVVSDEVIVNQDGAVISTKLQDIGVVVAAEVRAGVSPEEVIRVITELYTRNHRKEILIFIMAKPAPGHSVEVMVCCVSDEKYEPIKKRLESQGYLLLREPVVAYALHRETFVLNLKGNFVDAFMEDDRPVLEYQVGGRLNYTTFVLEVKNKNKPATGAIVVSRTTLENSQNSQVGSFYLNLTSFFPECLGSERGVSMSTIDTLLLRLSETLSTDHTRLYCYAMGVTKRELKSVKKGKHSPTEKNFRMLSMSRSMHRSEDAFLNHLLEVLERHKENLAVTLMKKTLQRD